MPEGPEVKRIVDRLSEELVGQEVTDVKILSGRYERHGPPCGFAEFGSVLPARVTDVSCKGKFIFMLFDNGFSMWNTLGMSGFWSPKTHKHARIVIETPDKPVFFCDTRNFGTVKFSSDSEELARKLASLGPDMLSEEVPDALFLSRMRKKDSKTVVEALMDQKVISGVGNYLKSESLYLAGISPHRKVCDISDESLSVLNKSVQTVIASSYISGGATIHTFLDYDGKEGGYSRRFAVYNQSRDIQNRAVLRETTRDGRTTFWVPEKQI
tara:strand:- start:85 stop:891 length:807 start_codon:yes stop_codon:yes gene_type:complete